MMKRGTSFAPAIVGAAIAVGAGVGFCASGDFGPAIRSAHAETSPGVPSGAAVEFETAPDRLVVVTRTTVYLGADKRSPPAYSLEPGTVVGVIAKSKDRAWAWVTTQNGRPAYIALADLGPVPPPPDHVSGRAEAITTSTVKIDSYLIDLMGIAGEGDQYVRDFQSLIDSHGAILTCDRRQQAGFTCSLPGVPDVGAVALSDGAADVTVGATAEYRALAETAKQAGKGIWKK